MNDEQRKPAKRRAAAEVEADSTLRPEIRTRRITPARPAPSLEKPESAVLSVNSVEREFLKRSLAGLTAREREVVFAICSGGTNEETADRLCIALPTLRTHLMRLNQKLGTTNKGDVVRLIACRLLDGYRDGSIQPAPTSEPRG